MTRELDRAAFELFDEVADLTPRERAERLDERCAANPELRALVERMLAEDAGVGSGPALEVGAGFDVLAEALHAGREEPAPERVGPYRVLRLLGRGGMGVVYEGEQDNPRRRVALKLVRAGITSDEARRRFRREAQLLGQLQHRGIAHVYEAGVAPVDGIERPFMAMELVEGAPLDRHADQQQLGTRARMELLARVCDAVQHAHQKGVLHRDLKPQNVLVVEEGTSVTPTSDAHVVSDAVGQPKVLDFGVARLIQSEGSDVVDTLHTGAGTLVGTLAYMSPEQVEGRVEQIDTRADIWSLGVMLHQLVTGRLPFDVSGLSLVEAAHWIATAEPRPPKVPEASVRADLATIVAKALEKDPARRYGSAGELADDLRRCLRDEPIVARRPTLAYQLRKFTRRNRALVGGAVGTVLALLGGLVAVTVLLARVSDQRDETALANQRQTRIAAFQAELLGNLDLRGMGETIRGELDQELGTHLGGLDPQQHLVPSDVLQLLEGVNATNLARASLESQLIDPAAARISREYGDDPIVEATLCATVARMYQSFNCWDKQLVQDRRALELRRANLGEEHPATIESYLDASSAAEFLNRRELAIELCRAGLERARRALGADHPLSLRAGMLLAGQITQQDPALAETILDDLIERGRALGDEARVLVDHCEVLLAGVYGRSGRVERAIEIYEGRVAGPHPDEALMAILAGLYANHGRRADALELRRRAVEVTRQRLGEQDERTIVARLNLARSLLDAGRDLEAHEQFEMAHGASLVGLPVGRLYRNIATEHWARSLLALGRYEQCEQVLDAALESLRRTPQAHDEATPVLLEQRAACRRAQGRDAEADADQRAADEALAALARARAAGN